jgi:hypothetical protein
MEHRLPVKCCQYTFDLLVKYLHVANQMALLAILNAHVAVTVGRRMQLTHSFVCVWNYKIFLAIRYSMETERALIA